MQYDFCFVFTYPAGCLHVTPDGSDGYAIDECRRVCGHACADKWARARGLVCTGVTHVHSHSGMHHQSFTTKKPHEIMRPAMAHLATLIRG